MRLPSTLLAAPLLMLLSAGGASAAVEATTIDAVVSLCPIEARVGSCANAVISFVSAQPAGEARNEDIIDLVSALATAARHPDITPYMCAELEEAILIAGSQVTLPAPRQQIADIASGLCLGEVDDFTTASIGGGSDVPPPSLSDNSGISDTPPPPPPPGGGGDEGGDEGGGDDPPPPPPPPPINIE